MILRGKALSCGLLALAALAACYETDDFLPTEPRLNSFLELVSENGQTRLPADGISRLRLFARISPKADLDRRTIVFTASKGTLIGGTTVNDTHEVDADSTGQALIELQSSQTVEDSVVQATVKNVAGLTRQLVINFFEADPDAVVRFTAAPSSGEADGASFNTFTVAISPSLPLGTVVKFKTNLSKFAQNELKEVDVTTDASFFATADLVSPDAIGTATVTVIAQVSNPNNVSRETRIDFGRALPDRITVKAEPDMVAAGADTEVTVTATLLRDRGDVTADTVVTYTAEHENGTEIDGFEDVERSTVDGTSTAKFTPGIGNLPGKVTITVGTNPSRVTGTDVIEITRVFPQSIVVEATDETISKTETVTVTAKLTRTDTQAVTEGTVVEFSAQDATGRSFGTFTSVTTSSVNGEATVRFTPGSSAAAGAATLIASTSNGVSGTLAVTIVD